MFIKISSSNSELDFGVLFEPGALPDKNGINEVVVKNYSSKNKWHVENSFSVMADKSQNSRDIQIDRSVGQIKLSKRHQNNLGRSIVQGEGSCEKINTAIRKF